MVTLPLGFLNTFVGAFDFILHQRDAVTGGGVQVGGPAYVWQFARTQLEVSAVALAGAIAIALPAGLVLGHLGRGEFFAVGFGNAGRAVPEIAVVLLLAAIIGIGLRNVAIALAILGLPPILTNTFVAVRQVDRTAVEAAEGMGMSGRRGHRPNRVAAGGAHDHVRHPHRGHQHLRDGDDRLIRRPLDSR